MTSNRFRGLYPDLWKQDDLSGALEMPNSIDDNLGWAESDRTTKRPKVSFLALVVILGMVLGGGYTLAAVERGIREDVEMTGRVGVYSGGVEVRSFDRATVRFVGRWAIIQDADGSRVAVSDQAVIVIEH